MRIAPFVASLIAVAAVFAGPACAQDAFSRDRELELRAQQDMARQRMNALQNEVQALEGQVRTEQALRDLRERRDPPRLGPREARQPGAGIPAGYASIPDETLAASNARVRAASGQAR